MKIPTNSYKYVDDNSIKDCFVKKLDQDKLNATVYNLLKERYPKMSITLFERVYRSILERVNERAAKIEEAQDLEEVEYTSLEEAIASLA